MFLENPSNPNNASIAMNELHFAFSLSLILVAMLPLTSQRFLLNSIPFFLIPWSVGRIETARPFFASTLAGCCCLKRRKARCAATKNWPKFASPAEPAETCNGLHARPSLVNCERTPKVATYVRVRARLPPGQTGEELQRARRPAVTLKRARADKGRRPRYASVQFARACTSSIPLPHGLRFSEKMAFFAEKWLVR